MNKVTSRLFPLIIFYLCPLFIFGQVGLDNIKTIKKGQAYLYWGWNNAWFTNSDINFHGEGYDFTLTNVVAKDRQSPFSIDIYINPINATIPQYNVKIGYFFKDHWDISIGTDHMKYVVVQNQSVQINGSILNSSTDYDGQYADEEIQLTNDFLKFEHTDGLNYANVELRRHDELISFGKINVNSIFGIGGGFLLPKTNSTLLNKERYDDFHLSGFGVGFIGAIKIIFFDRIFLQTEIKEGFINMPSIRTTQFSVDHASQQFFFTQYNVVFGAQFNLGKKDGNESIVK